MAIFGWAPVPNQIRNSGASATFGTLLSATNSGNSKRSSTFHSTMRTREQHAKHRGEGRNRPV